MKNKILETIAENSIFSIDEVQRVYEIFKSYDLLVAACELAQRTGHANLETACILVNVDTPIEEAKEYLARLLKSVYPDIEPLDTLLGLISQVDNGFAVPLKNAQNSMQVKGIN